MQQTTQFRTGFFDLLRELRDEIYSYTVISWDATISTCFGRQPVYEYDHGRRKNAFHCSNWYCFQIYKKARSLCHQMRHEVDEIFIRKHKFRVVMAYSAIGTRSHRQCISHHIWRKARHLEFECCADVGNLQDRKVRLTLAMNKETGQWKGQLWHWKSSTVERRWLREKRDVRELAAVTSLKAPWEDILLSEVEVVRKMLYSMLASDGAGLWFTDRMERDGLSTVKLSVDDWSMKSSELSIPAALMPGLHVVQAGKLRAYPSRPNDW